MAGTLLRVFMIKIGNVLVPTVLHQTSEASIAEKLIPFKTAGWESLVAYECASVFFFKYYSIAFAILTGIAGGLAQELLL